MKNKILFQVRRKKDAWSIQTFQNTVFVE